MLKNKYFKLNSVFRGCTALSIIIMIVAVLVGGCANQQANVDTATADGAYDTVNFSAMEIPSDAVEYQSEGIDMEIYGIDY